MKAEAWIFAICTVFFLLVAPAYWFIAGDPTGTSALVMTFLLTLLVTLYLGVHASKMEPRPEDRHDVDLLVDLVHEVDGDRPADVGVLDQLGARLAPGVLVEHLPVDPRREARDDRDERGGDDRGPDEDGAFVHGLDAPSPAPAPCHPNGVTREGGPARGLESASTASSRDGCTMSSPSASRSPARVHSAITGGCTATNASAMPRAESSSATSMRMSAPSAGVAVSGASMTPLAVRPSVAPGGCARLTRSR